MNIIKIKTREDEIFDSEKVSNIDLTKNIIISSMEHQLNFTYDDELLYLTLYNDITINTQKIVENKTIINYNPHIKWCIPKGIILIFDEYFSNTSIIDKIHINCDKVDNKISWLINYNFQLFINRNRCKNFVKLNNGSKILTVDFNYGPFCDFDIENIYIIQNDYIFQEFINHFSIG